MMRERVVKAAAIKSAMSAPRTTNPNVAVSSGCPKRGASGAGENREATRYARGSTMSDAASHDGVNEIEPALSTRNRNAIRRNAATAAASATFENWNGMFPNGTIKIGMINMNASARYEAAFSICRRVYHPKRKHPAEAGCFHV